MVTEAQARATRKWKASRELKRVEILLKPDTLEAVDAAAEARGIPRTRFVIEAVEAALGTDRLAALESKLDAALAGGYLSRGTDPGYTQASPVTDTADTPVSLGTDPGDAPPAPRKKPRNRGPLRETAGRVEATIIQARKDGLLWREVADLLNSFGFLTVHGKQWQKSATEAFARRRGLK